MLYNINAVFTAEEISHIIDVLNDYTQDMKEKSRENTNASFDEWFENHLKYHENLVNTIKSHLTANIT